MPPPPISRRSLLRLAAAGSGAAALTPLAACAVDTTTADPGSPAALADPDWALPDQVPDGLTLAVGDPTTQRALELSGLDEALSFTPDWANLSGGPETSEAFRAGALDLGQAAEVPAINAHWTDLTTKFVAARYRSDPLATPVYQLGIAPGVAVASLAELRGKRLAFSPSQAQGVLLIRVLAAAGLTRDDVELVEIPSTGDVYANALAGHQVDVAPVGGTVVKRYLEQYGAEGASTLAHGLRDDADHLWAPAEVLRDPGKAAAVAEYVRVWARAKQWIQDHPEEWVQGYYVEQERLSEADGRYLVEAAGQLEVPGDWADPVARTQETVDLLADFVGQPSFEAGVLFDHRFAAVGADALAEDGASGRGDGS